jgi:DNA-binding Xre family transcriptional regulator
MPVAYRLAKRDPGIRRLDLGTLDAVCRALNVQPGKLLEYVPDRKRRRP